jgi:tetratricopeptide (TPR) repeat protein
VAVNRDRRRIARLVDRLVESPSWDTTRVLLRRHPELVSQAAEDRLAELAEAAAEDGDREAAATYRFHRELILHCRAAGVDDAVAQQREALEAVPRLVDDGSAAYRRYRTTTSQTDLTAAQASFEQAASLARPGHPDRPVVLNNLGLALFEQFSLDHHRHADLDRAVAVLEESAGTAPMDAAERSAALANLGSALLARRGAGGFGRDLERAAEVLDEAARLAEDDPGERARRLNNLGIALSECYLRGGRPGQLKRAVAAYEQAVALTAADSPDRPVRLANLGTGLAERYTRHGDPADLDRAVDLMARAVAAASPETSPNLADWLENLGLVLRDRYLRDGDLADLDLAAARLTAAAGMTPADTAARPGRLDQLATTLRLRALRRGDYGELRQAVELHRKAARLAADAPERSVILNNLGGTLRAWASATDNRSALGEAVRAYREALGGAQAAERSAVLTNLGAALLDLYDRTGERRDLDEAIKVLAGSVAVTGPRSPERPARLNNLANGLRRRYERDGHAADAVEVTAAYRAGQRLGLEVATEAAMRCGLNWGDWSLRRQVWAQAHEAYDTARTAADRLLGQHLVRRDVETWLSAVGDMPAQAAYARCRTQEPGAAAVWLEWGRARVLSDVLDRARLNHLAASQPALFGRYRHAAARLNAGGRDRSSQGGRL